MQYLIGGIIGCLLCMVFTATVYFTIKAKVSVKQMAEMKERDEQWRNDVLKHYERIESQWTRIADSFEANSFNPGWRLWF